ncbi:MAG: potassium-transporting ATPase subunit C [Myxococcota bacterium]
MTTLLVRSVRFSLVWILAVGLAWPLATTVVGGLLFPHRATGSVVVRDGVAVGSELVGQPFVSDRYLIGRPSTCAFDPFALAGSNQAASNPDLRTRAAAASAAIAAREGVAREVIPVELVAASGSCIDPDLTVPGAALQLPRIARARKLPVDRVEAVLTAQLRGTGPLALGPARVNVLAFNLALDDLQR